MNSAHISICDLVRRSADKELTAVELVSRCVDRIAALDSKLHAMIAINPHAIEEARVSDGLLRAGQAPGPLQGIPIVVKDNIDVLGFATTSGCRALARAMPRRDAAQVARLRAAGAVIVGKANLSEFSFEIRSRSSVGGDTLNAFCAEATSGGSSGGTAVAVAAGFALAGIGTDTGGSIRIPASFNGLVGLRPTHGRLALHGVAPLAPSTDTIGPIARTIDEAALLFAVMTGKACDHTSIAVRGRRVGVMRQACGDVPAVVTALDRALAALRDEGAVVVDPVILPESILPIGGTHIVDIEFGAAFDAYLTRNFQPGTAPASLRDIVASGAFLAELEPALRARLAPQDPHEHAAVLGKHAALRDALAALMAAHALDALIHPTSLVVPETLDNPKSGWGAELAARSGWPALSVPSGERHGGIPIGVELMARAGAESLLLALGGTVEKAAGPRAEPLL